jgi:phosphoenolpyruvate-protein kinase (PTS system EI component)
MADYASPFNLKQELKKINEKHKHIIDAKFKKIAIEQDTKELKEYAEMLRKMSTFVNSKSKNGKMPKGFND